MVAVSNNYFRHDEELSFSLSDIPVQEGSFFDCLSLFKQSISELKGEIVVTVQFYSQLHDAIPATLDSPEEPAHFEWSDICLIKAVGHLQLGSDPQAIRIKADISPEENQGFFVSIREDLEERINELPTSYFEENTDA